MKKISLIIILNLILALGQVYLSARRATDGAELAELNDQLAAVHRQSQILRSQIYQASSVEQIQKESTNLQLSKVATQFFNLSLPVAQAR